MRERRFEKGLAGGGWQLTGPHIQQKLFSRIVSISPEGGERERMQERCLNLWHRKDFLAPAPSVRQPPFKSSDMSERPPGLICADCPGFVVMGAAVQDPQSAHRNPWTLAWVCLSLPPSPLSTVQRSDAQHKFLQHKGARTDLNPLLFVEDAG